MPDELYHALVDPGIKGESSVVLPTYPGGGGHSIYYVLPTAYFEAETDP